MINFSKKEKNLFVQLVLTNALFILLLSHLKKNINKIDQIEDKKYIHIFYFNANFYTSLDKVREKIVNQASNQVTRP